MDLVNFTVEMDDQTVESLRDGHFTLFGLHAIATSAEGAPAIWLSTYYLEPGMTVTWAERYSLFTTSYQRPAPGLLIRPTHRYPAAPGSVLTVGGNTGTGMVEDGAPAGHLEIDSRCDGDLSVGISMPDARGTEHPCGLFTLRDHAAELFQPVPKVAFFFSPIPHQTGEIAEQALGPGVLVDFTAAPDCSRTLRYSFADGWETGQSWARAIAPREPLSPLLTLRSQVLQALAMQRRRTLTLPS